MIKTRGRKSPETVSLNFVNFVPCRAPQKRHFQELAQVTESKPVNISQRRLQLSWFTS
jgi:hypothetical protein